MKHEHVTVTSKGQLVIPARLRRRYGIKKGTRVAILEEENRLILQPLTAVFVKSLVGWLGKKKPSALEYLLKERKKDRY